ncbi:MAG: DNA polymerase III subunit alpha [Candidatus Hydrogenedentota bacterium]
MIRNEFMSFVHLHVHSQFSLLDGAIKFEELMDRCHRFGMKSVAITDHGNMFGIIKFYKIAINNGIKPIIGTEVYLTPKSMEVKQATKDNKEKLFHLTLLAENIEGYRNLCRLSSLSYLRGFYYKPRLDKDTLRKYSKGIIALSGCMNGEIAYYILQDKLDIAKAVLLEYLGIFSHNNFFLEVMNHNLTEEKKVFRVMMEFQKELSVEMVATNDCHYLEKDDAKAHDVLLAIQTGKDVKEEDRLKMPNNEFYFKSCEEMKEIFKDTPLAIRNSLKIADRCSVDFNTKTFHIPKYDLTGTGFKQSKEYLRALVYEGRDKRYGDNITEEINKRIEYELNIIYRMNFADYFLIVFDLIKFCRDNGIAVGPGRGSAAGSIVAYCLYITDLDPLKYNLLFERFLNPDRISMPDIDIDFEDERRDEATKYLIEKYGEDRVVKVATFQNLKARRAIKEVGRVMGVPFSEMNELTKLVPDELNITIEQAISRVPRLKELIESNEIQGSILQIAQKLEGLPGYPSTHPAGVVIGDDLLFDLIPLFKDSKREEITSQYEKDSLEEIGLLKMDILGLKNLSIIKHTLKYIKEKRDIDINWNEIGLEDKKTYELLSNGETAAVFQLESDGMRELLIRLKPETFTDIIALIALYRPGPLGGNVIEDFVLRKHGKKEIEYFHPSLEPILKETYGIILYQEQVMQIAGVLAGFSMSQADNLRKAMAKKIPDAMEKYRDEFTTRAQKNGISEDVAWNIFNLMENFASYGFNKSHSAVYAVIAFQTAYLKAHYPVEFMTAVLNNEIGEIENIGYYFKECTRMGISVLKPDVNTSESLFVADKNKIKFGLIAIKNIGRGFGVLIEEARGNKIFESLDDFFNRVNLQGVSKRVLESLVLAGAFDSLYKNRKSLFDSLEERLDIVQKTRQSKDDTQASIFESATEKPTITFPPLKKTDDWDEITKLKNEKEMLGFYLSGHPVNKYKEKYSNLYLKSIDEIYRNGSTGDWAVVLLEETISKKDRTGREMAIVSLSDESSKTEALVFSSLYSQIKKLLTINNILFFKLKYNKGDISKRMIVEDCINLENIEDNISRLGIKTDALDEQTSVRIKEVIENYKGKIPVNIKFLAEDKKYITIKTNKNVYYSQEIVNRLKSILKDAEIKWILI